MTTHHVVSQAVAVARLIGVPAPVHMRQVECPDGLQRTALREEFATLVTRVGKLELRVPQDRDGRFSTELFERYQRSERALVATLAEMYVQGVSTRKVKAITEELCGHAFSASAISAINKRLDENLKAFAERLLVEPFPYLILDARHEKMREAGVVIACQRRFRGGVRRKKRGRVWRCDRAAAQEQEGLARGLRGRARERGDTKGGPRDRTTRADDEGRSEIRASGEVGDMPWLSSAMRFPMAIASAV